MAATAISSQYTLITLATDKMSKRTEMTNIPTAIHP